MTVYSTLIARGYFPKELPPAFFTELFAKFATSKTGRLTLAKYKPTGNFTECVKYELARPGLDRRELRIPHPVSFAGLADLTAKNFGRILKKASCSPISRSRPVYATGRHRSIQPMVRHSNLARERAVIRAGSSYLLKTDVSQFYPSLYTHAVGWAVDPQLRNRTNWGNTSFLGKKLDQALMDLDGKVSQGVPIGNDISFLLSELVLAQVDKAIRARHSRALRWFDDYEFAADTREQAEEILKRLNKELGKFKLRLNPRKTTITRLPSPTHDFWQETLKQSGIARVMNTQSMIRYFDAAFRLRDQFPDEPVMMYALGLLFKLNCPTPEVARIAQSCITQGLLCEPGAAQKGFALLTFWGLNGLKLDAPLLTNTINKMVLGHQAGGFSSDVSWALAFCLDHVYTLNAKAAQVLSGFDDDCIALQALHMERSGLLPKGFNKNRISKALKNTDLDREHWLIAYETVRHGFLTICAAAVKSNPLFSELLKHKVTFYRRSLPHYATILHAGGAPDWIVRLWISTISAKSPDGSETSKTPILKLIGDDLAKIDPSIETDEDAIIELMDVANAVEHVGDSDTY